MNIEKDLKRYKLKTDESGKLYDPIRQIFVPATPEEYVRQRMIKYLIGRMKIPAGKIVVEQGLVEEVYQNPQHEYTKKLLDAALI